MTGDQSVFLNTLMNSIHEADHPGPPPGNRFQPTSVMALMGVKPEPFLLLIQKADVPGYPWRNQMAFPGGHVDPEDSSRLAAAFRELNEETGISARHVEAVGSLGHFQTINNRDIEAFAGIWDQKQPVHWDPKEISRVFEVPICHLREIHYQQGFSGRMPGFDELIYPWEDVTIWGVTAKIIHHFMEITEDAVSIACPGG